MFIPVWAIIVLVVILVWSLWLNVVRSKQIRLLNYCFYKMSDFAKESIDRISTEQVEPEIAATEWEQKVDFHLELLRNNHVAPLSAKEEAKVLGIA